MCVEFRYICMCKILFIAVSLYDSIDYFTFTIKTLYRRLEKSLPINVKSVFMLKMSRKWGGGGEGAGQCQGTDGHWTWSMDSPWLEDQWPWKVES